MFYATTKENVRGKPEVSQLANALSIRSGAYDVSSFDTLYDLLEYAYIEGRAYCHGVVDVERHKAEVEAGTNTTATPRSYDYFQFCDLMTVDIDKPTTREHTLEFIQAQPWASSAGLIYPSSSYTPDAPRWHVVFRLDQRISDRHEFAALAAAFYAQINLPVDDSLASAIQLSFGTEFRDKTIVGKPLELTYVNEEAVLSVEWLRSLADYVAPRKVEYSLTEADQHDMAALYVNSAEGSYRAEQHQKQTPEDRERVVIDALTALLPTLGEDTSYQLWTQIWMSAHAGSPTAAVHDLLLTHPSVYWSDGDAGRLRWHNVWINHVQRPDGYTVASLFWLAERRGNWLKYTPYDVPNSAWQIIDVPLITAWTEEFERPPERVLLHSQTGSGKTHNLIHLWHKLEQPRTVVFVPTMKLAADLATTLIVKGVPATLYYDADTMQIKDGEALRAAQVLVTTLQTFGQRVYNRPGMMADYGLVYMEESDQLLSQFGLARTTFLPSHVNERQAQQGFALLREACEQSGYVWFVDATMTQITVDAARSLCPAYRQPLLVRNQFTKLKADVELLTTKQEAYNIALTAIMRGRKTVVACDTKAAATEFHQILQDYGLHMNRRVLLITKDTEAQPQVVEFMRNGNAGANRYDVVIYNSVMASGVSITSVKPDVLVQIAEYLTPRSNLQILNRYRLQNEVYCYYAPISSLYGKTATELQAEAQERVEVEADVLGLPLMPRAQDAQLRSYLGAMAGGDAYAQMRNARAFYRRLLRDDGRRIIDHTQQVLIESLNDVLTDVRTMRRERKEHIRTFWRSVRPVGPDAPADADMTPLDIACGMEHYHIRAMLNDFVPEQQTPEDIYDVVHNFQGSATMLSVFANQPAAYSITEGYMADPTRPDTTFYNNVTRLSVLTLLLDVWGEDLAKTYTLTQLEEAGRDFLTRLDAISNTYDIMVRLSAQQYRKLLQDNDTVAGRVLAFSKALLATVGLKVGKLRFGTEVRYGVLNLDEAVQFLTWRHHWSNSQYKPDFAGTAVTLAKAQQEQAAEQFKTMTEVDRQLTLSRWNGDNTTFYYAVKSVLEDLDWA